MAEAIPLDVERLPTLTEVLELGSGLHAAQPWTSEVPPSQPSVVSPAAASKPARLLDEAAIVEQVLLALQPRIDTLLESRVSEALAPAIARAADALIRESRDELFTALRGLAEESLSQVLRKNGLHGSRDSGQG